MSTMTEGHHARYETAFAPLLMIDKVEVKVEEFPEAVEMTTKQPQSQEAATQPQENVRKKAASTLLDEAVEIDLGQWLQEHPCLYNKRLKDYKNKTLKDRLYEEKAKSVGITGKELRTWFESMRTRYGKLTRERSGPGALGVRKLTDRDKWILNLLSFLETHIVRQKTGRARALALATGCRPAVGPPAALAPDHIDATAAAPLSPSHAEASSGGEEAGEEHHGPHAEVSRPSSSVPPNKRKKVMSEEAVTSLLKRLEQEATSREQFELISQPLTPALDPLALWARTLGEEARQLSAVRQRCFRMEVQGTLERYLKWESEGYTPSSLVECLSRGQGVAVVPPYPPTPSHLPPLP